MGRHALVGYGLIGSLLIGGGGCGRTDQAPAESDSKKQSEAPAVSAAPEDPPEPKPKAEPEPTPPAGESGAAEAPAPEPTPTPEPEGVADSVEAIALEGPFADIKALCKDAKKKAVNPEEECGEQGHPPGLGPKILFPKPLLGVKFLEVGDPGRGAIDDVSCVLAVQTKKGWFHHTWHCEGFVDGNELLTRFDGSVAEDRMRHDDEELVVTLAQTFTSGDLEQTSVFLCDGEDPEHPWCVGPVVIAGKPDDPDAKGWALKLASTQDGFSLAVDRGEVPAEHAKRVGTYVVETLEATGQLAGGN